MNFNCTVNFGNHLLVDGTVQTISLESPPTFHCCWCLSPVLWWLKQKGCSSEIVLFQFLMLPAFMKFYRNFLTIHVIPLLNFQHVLKRIIFVKVLLFSRALLIFIFQLLFQVIVFVFRKVIGKLLLKPTCYYKLLLYI